MKGRRSAAPSPVVAPAVNFQVRDHVLRLLCQDGRWAVSVDGVALGPWFTTQVSAWEAGVREADRLDLGAGP